LLLSYVFIFSGYYLVYQDLPQFRKKSRARFGVHVVCGIGVIALWQLSGHFSRSLEIWALDVGQGDSTFIRFPGGQTMLVDGGRSEPDMGSVVVAPQLRGMGVRRLDFVVATHDDDDHVGGLATLLRDVGCRRLLLPAGFEAKSQASRRLMNAARDIGCEISSVSEGFVAESGGCRVTVLNPKPGAAVGALEIPDNEMSTVLRVEYGSFQAFLMGDAGLSVEGRLLSTYDFSSSATTTLLKLGHHGSRTASSREFIQAVGPQLALVSCGLNNQFGHPAAVVMERIAESGATVLRTDYEGAIRITADGKTAKITRRLPLRAGMQMQR